MIGKGIHVFLLFQMLPMNDAPTSRFERNGDIPTLSDVNQYVEMEINELASTFFADSDNADLGVCIFYAQSGPPDYPGKWTYSHSEKDSWTEASYFILNVEFRLIIKIYFRLKIWTKINANRKLELVIDTKALSENMMM